MKILSLLTLFVLFAISSCSLMNKSCCAKKEAVTCAKTDCKMACCDKDKKCSDGSCKEAASCAKGITCTMPDCKMACCDKDKKCTDGSCTDAKKDCKGDNCKKKP